MHTRNQTQEAADFIATGDSRNTSPEIMEAIAFFARDLHEAEDLWNGDGWGVIAHHSDMWERVTKNGLHHDMDFSWGTAGRHWYSHLGFLHG